MIDALRAPGTRASTTAAPRMTVADDAWLVRIAASDGGLTATAGQVACRDGLTVAFSGTVVGLCGPVAAPPDGGHSAGDILQAFLDRGEGLLPDLRGQFAMVIADARTCVTRILRDPLGAHPLFCATVPDAVLVASRPRTLLAQPAVPGGLNRMAIADHLSKRWPLRHETFFEAVDRVPPGWLVEVTPGGLRRRRYWNPVDPSGPIDFLADDEVERFGSLLDLATARALTGRQTALLLSGGFDSVSIGAVACDLATQARHARPIALSIAFPDRSCDERTIQTSVAATLGLPHEILDFDQALGDAGLLRRGLELNADLDAPLFNTWMPAYLALLDTAAARGVDTLLTGDGGDEWLGTTPFLAADLWGQANLAGLVRLARTWKRSFRQTWPTLVRAIGWTYGLRPLAGRVCHRVAPERWEARRARRIADATPDFISRDPVLRTALHARIRAHLPEADPVGGFYAREARVFLDHPLMSWVFEEQFVFAAARGLRYVRPYWDADLVAHMYRVPPERLNRDGRTKALVRETVDRRFPGLGFRRQRKVTATEFFADLVRREAPALARDVDDFRGLASLGIVDPVATKAFLRGAWTLPPRGVGMAWNVVNMEYWVRRHLGL